MQPDALGETYGEAVERLGLHVRFLGRHIAATVQGLTARAEYERLAHQLVSLEGGDFEERLAQVEADPARAYYRMRCLAMGLTASQIEAAETAGLTPELVQAVVGITAPPPVTHTALTCNLVLVPHPQGRRQSRRERKQERRRKERKGR